MDARHRLAPARPAALRQQARLDPLGQIGRARQRLLGKLPHPPVAQPFGQAIDRLALRQVDRLGRIEHMVGVDHLQFLPVHIELARDDARLAQRQQLLAPARLAAEEDAGSDNCPPRPPPARGTARAPSTSDNRPASPSPSRCARHRPRRARRPACDRSSSSADGTARRSRAPARAARAAWPAPGRRLSAPPPRRTAD